MANILLLYDTKEKDLARDIKDLLDEVNVESVTLIPLSPDKGLTLEEKEKHYFDSASGAIFLITPGSERFGSFFPSPSVSHEMGQAKLKFQKKPECVVYLVDKNCEMPSIDQKSYIRFDRSDMRSVMSALTQTLRDLKTVGLFRTAPIPTEVKEKSKSIDLATFVEQLDASVKDVIIDISNRKNGYISDSDLNRLLIESYNLEMQAMNLLKKDLERFGVVVHNVTATPYFSNSWFLNDLGWEVVRYEVRKQKKTDRKAMSTLAALLSKRIKG